MIVLIPRCIDFHILICLCAEFEKAHEVLLLKFKNLVLSEVKKNCCMFYEFMVLMRNLELDF
jgi:hypothetical protein